VHKDKRFTMYNVQFDRIFWDYLSREGIQQKVGLKRYQLLIKLRETWPKLRNAILLQT